MPEVQQKQPEVGHFTFEVYGAGRQGRRRSSSFQVRCHAIGLHQDQILLLSVVGPETAVKALTAGLRSSKRDQQWIDYSVRVGNLNVQRLAKCPEGYRIFRTKFEYGLWHVLCLAKRAGFLPVMTEETVGRLIQGDQFTTPVLREWMPWLFQQMKEREIVVPLTQHGCQAGLLEADDSGLETLVCEGIQHGHLAINGRTVRTSSSDQSDLDDVSDLDDYMLRFGTLLGQQAVQSLDPLHVPGLDPLPDLNLLRDPFDAQAHVIEAIRKTLARQKALLLVGEMGTGKTIMGMAAIHAHAGNRPYRALVFCPGQLVNKWEREIRATIPCVDVIQIESWKSLLHLKKSSEPAGVEWYIIARDRAKLGPRWRPAYCPRA